MSDAQTAYKQDVFPVCLMSIIVLAGLASSIASTSLFPFVAFMMVDLGLVKSVNQAGAYAGFIAGAFMGGRMLSSLPWGVVADRWGRKPVLVISSIAIFGTSILFGLSKSFEMAVLSRLLMGLGNAVTATSKTVIGELVPKRFQSQAMALLEVAW